MEEQLVISDINGICRLCLKDNGTIIPIFGRENTSRDCIPLSKKILDCVSVNVVNGDGLSPMICVSCVHQVDSWHGFKNTCDTSQKRLSSWLQLNNPELYEKNELLRKQWNRKNQSTSTSVIDLSSEDDDVVVQPLVGFRSRSERRRTLKKRQSTQLQSIELLSINTNEIEILPVNDPMSISDADDESAQPSTSGPSTQTSVTIVPSRSSISHLSADSGVSEDLAESVSSATRSGTSNEPASTDGNTKQDQGGEELLSNNIKMVTITLPEDNNTLAEIITEGSFENNEDPLATSDPLESSGWHKLKIRDNESDIVNNANTDDAPIETVSRSDIEDSELSLAENNRSSLVIEGITSLKEHDTMGMIEPDKIPSSRLSHEGDLPIVQPDIVLCDSSVMINIKEELLSGGEGAADEEDPLSFNHVAFRRNSEDFPNENPDVKPNIRLLNEAMDNNYLPKRLKCGKLHCEPCRVSFINDISYHRHTTSMRHKFNFKLYKSGRAPTRKRGRSLLNAIMGNNLDVHHKNKSPFYCDQCPSAFKHIRNLKSHQKKHLTRVPFNKTEESGLSEFRETLDESQGGSSKPLRLSTLNVNYGSQPEVCDLCHQTFSTLPAILSHKRYCGSVRNRVCALCHNTFTTFSLYFKHRKECRNRHRQAGLMRKQRVARSSLANNDESTLNYSMNLVDHMNINPDNNFATSEQGPSSEIPEFAKPNYSGQTNDTRLHNCKYCFKAFPTHGALASHTGYHARKSLYSCKFCRHSYRDKLTFRQHMKVHIGNPSLNKNVCWICYTPYSSHQELIEHKKVHTKILMQIFSCDLCDNSYNTRELLSKHKKSTHGMPATSGIQYMDEDNKLYKCKICKKRFTTLPNLRRHTIIHKRPPISSALNNAHVDQYNPFRCIWCFRTFKTQSGLLNHKPLCNRVKTTAMPMVSNVMHSYNKSLRCRACKKWFASRNTLYKHMKRCKITQVNTIVPLRPQNCPNCDQQFLSEESLDRHKQHCKPSIDRLTCDCGAVFASIELKKDHGDTCPSNSTCKHCNMKFNSPEEMEYHKSICQLEPETQPLQRTTVTTDWRSPPTECHKCKRRFIYNKCLQVHLNKCLNDRWPCPNCLEVFTTETALMTHKSHKNCNLPKINRSALISTLSENKMFKCEYCIKRFPSDAELKQHLNNCENKPSTRQTDADKSDRPWKCDMCDKGFLWKANLYRHKKMIHHSGSPSKRSPSVTDSKSGSSAQEGEKEQFRCELCPGITFHKEQGFFEHQLAHERDGSKSKEVSVAELNNVLLTCELCDKRIPEILYPMHMDEHMNDDFDTSSGPVKEEATSSEFFACDICGKEFASAISRKSHRATHYRKGVVVFHQTTPTKSKDNKQIKVKQVRCPTCNKLLSINSMHKHRMMHAREEAEFYGDNQSLAPVKKSSSPTVSGLPDVPEMFGEEGEPSVYPCPKCDGSFKLQKSLVEHMKTHADDSMETESTSSATGTADQYQYKCVYCDLSWKYKSVYERHLTSKKHLEYQKQLSGII